mgnify:FL=1
MNYNINQYNFSSALAAGQNTLQTNHAIAGEILSIDWKTDTTGSMFVVTSGTNQLLFSRIAPSGTVWQHSSIGEFVQVATGSITAASMRGYPANEPLILAVSGANTSTVSATIRYR